MTQAAQVPSTDSEPKSPIIVALDGKTWEETFAIAQQLRSTGVIFKVNDLIFEDGFANLIPDLQVFGRVMADLKLHDIPNTVTNTCNRLRKNPPWAVTVHASGGHDMVKAAVVALAGTPTKVLTITVLTSINEATGQEIYNRLPAEEVAVLAKIAADAGADGLVCSPEEVRSLRDVYPWMTMVTPGIRSDGTPKDDQARIATPKVARQNGADFLVMGRQILGAPDSAAEVRRVMTEELAMS